LNNSKFLILFSILFVLITVFIYYFFSSPKNKNNLIVINQIRYASIDGWETDDQLKALEVFSNSCKKIISFSPKKNLGSLTKVGESLVPFAGQVSDWIEPCQAAIGISLNNNKDARLFFQKWFLPFSISSSNSYNSIYKGDDLGLFTGYYEPMIEGNYFYNDEYKIPIYAYPKNYISVNLGEFKKSLKGERIIGRIQGNNFLPADSRSDINQNGLEADVLYWAKNKIDVFFLHIQGSGLISFPDGKKRRISFSGSNGHDYFAIGRELIKKGYVSKEDISMQSIKKWLNENPIKTDHILNLNKRYIFFKKSINDFPNGALGTSLVGQRSLAVDTKFIPLGIPLWVYVDNHNDKNKYIIKKLMISQDTGAAIKGIVRGDIFFGTGDRAALFAGKLNQLGKYYALLPRKLVLRRNARGTNE